MRALVAAALLIGACSDFEPQQATFACQEDRDCAPGWVCVDAGAGPVCAEPVDVIEDVDTAAVVADTKGRDAATEGVTDTALVTDLGMTYSVEGDQLVQVGGAGRRYFIAPDAMTFSDAEAFCASLDRAAVTWKLATLPELSTLSRCCRTLPGSEQNCAGHTTCVLPTNCTVLGGCQGCGEPPSGDACWWHPTFAADCDAYWISRRTSCDLAFDFRISEITRVDTGSTARVMCTNHLE